MPTPQLPFIDSFLTRSPSCIRAFSSTTFSQRTIQDLPHLLEQKVRDEATEGEDPLRGDLNQKYWDLVRRAETSKGSRKKYGRERAMRVLGRITNSHKWSVLHNQYLQDARIVCEEVKGVTDNPVQDIMRDMNVRLVEEERGDPVAALKRRIRELEKRLRVEQAFPPIADPGKYLDARILDGEASPSCKTRPTERVIGRRRSALAALEKKNKRGLRAIIAEWRVEIEELVGTLAEFRAQLEQYEGSKGEPDERLQRLRSEKQALLKRRAQLVARLEEVKGRRAGENTEASITEEKRVRNEDPSQSGRVKPEGLKEHKIPGAKANPELVLENLVSKPHTSDEVSISVAARTAHDGTSIGSNGKEMSLHVASGGNEISPTSAPRPEEDLIFDVTRRSSSQKPRSTVLQSLLPSENLKAAVPTSGFVQVDPSLHVNLDASVPELQEQIIAMRDRLRNAYPRIDTLPYDVWTSTNRNTLKTWLRILIGKWRTRFHDVEEAAREEEDGAVDRAMKMLLDEMVREHDLSNEAAVRMANRWKRVFEKKGKMDGDAAGTLDWEEFDASFAWLRDEPVKVQGVQGSDTMLSKELPSGLEHKEEAGLRIGDMARSFLTLRVQSRSYSTSPRPTADMDQIASSETASPAETCDANPTVPSLPHLTSSGTAHMVSVAAKPHTLRTAIATGTVLFSNRDPLPLIRTNSLKKGDVLSISRIAGIMAAKKCPELVPLCHPIMLTHVSVELALLDADKDGDEGFGGVRIEAKVQCEGQTGVEMEALTAVVGAALSVVDMCKAVDKGMRMESVRVVMKEGGRSGIWREEGWESIMPKK